MESELLEALSAESQRIQEDALYSARGHFEAAALWGKAHYWIGVPAAVLAAVAGASAIADRAVIAGMVGILVTALSALAVFLNPSDRSNQHHAAGARFSEVKNLARAFREIELRATDDPQRLVDRLKALGAQRDELNKSSPQIPRWAFNRGRKSIRAGEADYAIDKRPDPAGPRPE